jgi:hypothetical protein
MKLSVYIKKTYLTTFSQLDRDNKQKQTVKSPQKSRAIQQDEKIFN